MTPTLRPLAASGLRVFKDKVMGFIILMFGPWIISARILYRHLFDDTDKKKDPIACQLCAYLLALFWPLILTAYILQIALVIDIPTRKSWVIRRKAKEEIRRKERNRQIQILEEINEITGSQEMSDKNGSGKDQGTKTDGDIKPSDPRVGKEPPASDPNKGRAGDVD